MGQLLRGKAGVLAERNFRTFYLGYVTSQLGTAMSTVALVAAVERSTGSESDLGYVMAANVVPMVVLLPFAGAIADRAGRRRVMLGADVLRSCAQAALAAALFAGRPPLWSFLLLAWLRGSGDAFFSPALNALTVEMAPANQLGNANALYGLAGSATRIAGPALSGVIVAFAGSATVIAVDAASYAVSVLALSALRLPWVSQTRSRTLLRDVAEGWKDFRSQTWLWAVTLQWAFFNLITWAPWMLLGSFLGLKNFGPAAWGAIMAAQGTGTIVGGLGSLGRRPRRPMVIAMVAMFGYALPDIPMALRATAGWVALAAFACGAGAAVFGTFFDTAVQQHVPPDKLARVVSLTMFPSLGIGVIGYGIDGSLADAFGASAVFAVGAVYGMLSSAILLALPSVRAIRWKETV
ncbi:MAG TPA: MFS transporter [Streptosporangiaceae bacterium]